MVVKSVVGILIIIANGLMVDLVFAEHQSLVNSGEFSAQQNESVSSCSVEPELQTLLDLHNQSRQRGLRCGAAVRKASKLQWSCELAVAAKKHADDMAKNEFLAHKGSDDSSFGGRATQAGFEWLEVSENIAQGFDSPNEVYQSWLDSSAHCENIISRKYSEFGAARFTDYWVVMMGSR